MRPTCTSKKRRSVVICLSALLLFQNTHFKFQTCLALIIDEADRILEVGFEEDMRRTLNILPDSDNN